MNTVEVLRGAKALISTPETWTKDKAARDSDGRLADCESDDAVCFCSLGAIWRVAGMDTPDSCAAEEVLQGSLLEPALVASFNDYPETTHADVMAAFDRAIARAEASA